jgi:ATP-dependent DNA helicase RecG|tara:strand:+ start:20181 stop:22262 length:2082 start_codon:yes stop_codon:yes gene_type:complete
VNSITTSTSLQSIKGVGPARADVLSAIGINTVSDLLHYYPRKHLDRTTVTPISKLKRDQEATVIGKVEAADMRRGKRRQYFQAILSDGKGMMSLTWFNGASYIKKAIKVGGRLAVSGKVEFFNGFQIVHPEYDKLKEDEDPVNSGLVIPLYSIPAELKKTQLDSRGLRRLIKNISDSLNEIPDHFSPEFRKTNGLTHINSALRNIHFAESEDVLNAAIRRLKFDEHFFLQMLMALRKSAIQQTETKALTKIGPQVKLISDSLDFDLTDAQKKVIKEIKDDMARPFSMNRLLQGDVGSGKTIVSVLAAAIAVANDVQVAVMAPTEILAHQHYESFKKHAKMAHMTCAILVGGTPAKERKAILDGLAEGRIDIIIGTHALIQKDVAFKALGLAIVDEQHRFGVLQRGDLTAKGLNPHLLAMTATPIPRTLAITYHGDMDLSIIDEMPKDRISVVTKVVDEQRLKKVYDFMKAEVAAGRQCMVVYPLVEETEKSDLAAAVEMHANLSEKVFPELEVGLIHGRMKKDEKDAVMDAYSRNEIHILISTTVIEVGIDIPNATVMLVEHADRFGLTQLHQLRGRVGRGSEKSYCILVRRNFTDNSKKRLGIMESTNDGFVISDEDLKLRGPGEFFGIRQSGFLKYKIADMVTDGPILRKTRQAAFELVKDDPNLNQPDHELIRTRFMAEYQDKLEQANIS